MVKNTIYDYFTIKNLATQVGFLSLNEAPKLF
jgi:hypothetical protein